MCVGIENFGYLDVCNIFEFKLFKMVLFEIDEYGVVMDKILNFCEFVYVILSY